MSIIAEVMHNIKMQRTADVSAGPLYDSLAAADLGVIQIKQATDWGG
jgi:hypothetical protein